MAALRSYLMSELATAALGQMLAVLQEEDARGWVHLLAQEMGKWPQGTCACNLCCTSICRTVILVPRAHTSCARFYFFSLLLISLISPRERIWGVGSCVQMWRMSCCVQHHL